MQRDHKSIGGEHLAGVVAGGLSATGMLIGALGPWIETPLISVGGWAGIGLPVVLVAAACLGLEMLGAVTPRRLWSIFSLGAGIVCFLASALGILTITALGRFSGLISLLFARGDHQQELSNAVSLGWGLPLLATASLATAGVSIARLTGMLPVERGSGTDDNDDVADESETSPKVSSDWG